MVEIPFTRFFGRAKQLHVADVADVFDVFFPRFRTEEGTSSFITRGGGRASFGNVTLAADTAVFTERGRERRFAGDATLLRKQYYCLEDAPTNRPTNNTLLGELFAYAEPRLPVQPSLLDSTVDVEESRRLAEQLSFAQDQPCIYHIVEPRDDAWLFSPALGLPRNGCVLKYPLTVADLEIQQTIDLRLPETQRWFFDTFVRMELEGEGKFVMQDGETLSVLKLRPPSDFAEFVPTLLSQELGGGSTFVQGIGAWLRANRVEALIYPSARSDSWAIVKHGQVVESCGYILVDYRGSPPCAFDATRYFGVLPQWRERTTRSIDVRRTVEGDAERFAISGVRKVQEYRFAVFHDWSKNSLGRARSELKEGRKTLGDRVALALRRPTSIIGSEAESVLGTDQEFLTAEGGPETGFLVEWTTGPSSSMADFFCTILPAPVSYEWPGPWGWDKASWFLHRQCAVRPWVVLKCPCCFSELFWDVPAGAPLGACPGCNFSNRGNDSRTTSATFEKEAARFDRHAEWSDQENIRIYSLACERYVDAVTGVNLPVHPRAFRVVQAVAAGYRPGPHWFMQRDEAGHAATGADIEILCPRCAWTSLWGPADRDDFVSSCPSCQYAGVPARSVDKGSSNASRHSQMPEEFARSVSETIIAVMNNPNVRNAIDRVDPKAADAAEQYGRIFGWAIPSLPPLRAGDLMVIAERLKRVVTIDGRPLAMPANEVFAFLSRIVGRSSEKSR